ncbi:MAG: DAK2 domain-containing protein [Deinococcus sp.]
MSDPHTQDNPAQQIGAADVAAALERAARRLIELRDTLNTLDAALGDGDSGLTAEKGARGLLAYLDATPPGDDLGKWLAGAGMAYNRAAPSTMGALVATALMRAGKAALGRGTLDPPLLARMLLEADAGIQERGKSAPGDKTVLDALHPAAQAFSAAISAGRSPAEADSETLEAARQGRDAAIGLRSRVGRAGWVGERSEGQPDPGTVLFVGALEAVLGADFSEPGSILGG